MPRVGRTEAGHVMATNPPVDVEDRKVIAAMMQRPLDELDAALEAAYQLGGDYSFVWFDREARTLRISGPLPEHVRARIIVRRTVNLSSEREAPAGDQDAPADPDPVVT
jgi:hypothetical protein